MNPTRNQPEPIATPSNANALQRSARERNPWRTWGPYLSERQWGTVRED